MRNCLERAAPARVPGTEPSNLEPAHAPDKRRSDATSSPPASLDLSPARAPVSCSPATLHGGNCSIRAATRRRHAGRVLLMLQNPPFGPGCAVRRTHLSASAWAAGYEPHPSRARRRCRTSASRHVPYPAFGPRRRRSVCREFTSGTNQGCLGVVADNDRTLGSGRL